MKSYRSNAAMAGVLYLLGTLFGIASAALGGEALASMVQAQAKPAQDLLAILAAAPWQPRAGAFLVFLMGLSLIGMTVFLYPLFRRDSEELALGMLLFRGGLEGSWYLLSALGLVGLAAIGSLAAAAGADPVLLASLAGLDYRVMDFLGPLGSLGFLVGASCLYLSFIRTRLIPLWLSIWGLAGVLPYLAYVLLHFFGLDHGAGFYLQMLLAPQELVMALWLIIRGFERPALQKLLGA